MNDYLAFPQLMTSIRRIGIGPGRRGRIAEPKGPKMTLAALTTGQFFAFPILGGLLVAILIAGYLGNPKRKANRRRAIQRANRRDGIGRR